MLTIDSNTICNLKEVACSDKLTEKCHQTLKFPQGLCSASIKAPSIFTLLCYFKYFLNHFMDNI